MTAHHQDGRRREVELLVLPLRAGDEGARWLLAAATAPPRPDHDVTMEWAFTQSGVPIAIYDADLRLLRANEELRRVSGLTEDDIRARRTGFLPESRTRAEVLRALRKVLATGEAVYARTFHRGAAEKRERAWAIALAPLKDPDGRVCALALTDRGPVRSARTGAGGVPPAGPSARRQPPRAAETTLLASSCTRTRWSGPRKDSA